MRYKDKINANPEVTWLHIFARFVDISKQNQSLGLSERKKLRLDAPFEWIVFLHPTQRSLAERDWTGPTRVVGSAGTGKTVVALHRTLRLLTRDPQARVLLTTFSTPLAEALADKLKLMTAERPGVFERAAIASFDAAARDLVTLATGRTPFVADPRLVRQIVTGTARRLGMSEFSPQFLVSEWEHVVDAWRLASLEDYAAVPRMGRKNRLGSRQRERLWQVFGAVIGEMKAKGLHTPASLFEDAVAAYARRAKPFDHIIVDEAQDLGVPELRFLAGIAADRSDALFEMTDATGLASRMAANKMRALVMRLGVKPVCARPDFTQFPVRARRGRRRDQEEGCPSAAVAAVDYWEADR